MLYQPANETPGNAAAISMYSDDMLFEMMTAHEELIARHTTNGAPGQEHPDRPGRDRPTGK